MRCWKCIFLSWSVEAFFEKVLYLNRDCNLHQQMRFQAKFSSDITHLNQLYLFGHVARASQEDDRLIALLAGIEMTCGRMKNTKKNALEQPGPGAWRTILHH